MQNVTLAAKIYHRFFNTIFVLYLIIQKEAKYKLS